MKKIVLLAAIAISVMACNKTPETANGYKTAYVDTQKMMENYTEAKELDDKYKTKGEVMGHALELEAKKIDAEKASFQVNANAKGQAWAQQKYGELQQRQQQLQIAQQNMLQQLQQESGKEMDTLVKSVKQFIKDYGKKEGYDYIYGTGSEASILYGKEAYDLTKVITKELNDNYASKAKPAKTEEKAEEKK